MFLSPAGEIADRVCTACGKDPSLGVEAGPASPALARPAAAAAPVAPSPSSGGHRAHGQRVRGRGHLIAKIVVVWIVLLAAIFTGARLLWKSDTEAQEAPAVAESAEAPESGEDLELLNQGAAPSDQAFSRFLTEESPEGRSQFVLRPMVTAAKMDRFYSLNPWLPLDPGQLTATARAVLSLPAGKAIETQWSSPDGHLLDAVFVQEDGEWRLDWEHFARASDYPWTMFLAGSGGDEGEFRLLARERLAKERKREATISLVLHAPRFGRADELGSQSPEILVLRDSKNGRLLEAAFELSRSGKRVFGVDLPNIDPEEFIRVRVKIRRGEPAAETRFELEEVIAPHWYSTDEPGVEISDK